MLFRRAVLGFKAPEVEAYIQELKEKLEEKDKTIKELENRVMNLEFDKDDLEAELNVYKTIHMSRENENNKIKD
ncbi:MAG: hypothetical protein PUC64_08615 [Clostridium sp.]|nr:hypothetical protein [Clostridium sp.]